MAEILVRNLDAKTVSALKKRARHHRTSLQQEAKSILEESARTVTANSTAVAGRIRANLAKKGSRFSDSGARQAEDRRR